VSSFARGIGDAALADVLGGFDGGRSFWAAMLAALELAIARSRDRDQAFSSYPSGELRRFLRDVDDALSLAVTAVTVQEVLNRDDRGIGTPASRRAAIDEVLQRRARQAAAAARAGRTGTG
jgi:hypothetical protein